jgi:hypothetical protein
VVMSALSGRDEREVPFGKDPASKDYGGTHVLRSEGTAVMRTPRKWSMGWAASEGGEDTKTEAMTGGDTQERGG